MTETTTMRLALRHESPFWNAYIAESGTMDGAVLIGSIAMAAVINNPDRKEAFMQMMRETMEEVLLDILGMKATGEYDVVKAPAHERRGRQ